MLSKPQWLSNWLLSLHWQIFDWSIDVGTPIEEAIDWLLGGVNNLFDYVITGVNQLVSYINITLEELQSEFNELLGQWQQLADWFSSLPDTFEEWRLLILSIANDIIDSVVSWITDRILDLETAINVIRYSFEDFINFQLPDLASKYDLIDAINSLRIEWADLFNYWESIKSEITSFFDDPLQWFYDKLDEFFERFW